MTKVIVKKVELLSTDFCGFDDASLAEFLGIGLKTLWWAVLNRSDLYTIHKIPKATGGLRIIHAPDDRLKMIQEKINTRILNPLQENLGTHVLAYRTGRSIKDGVMSQAGTTGLDRGTLIKIDLKDFFPSTKKTWIMRTLMSLKVNEEVSDLLSSLMTVPSLDNPGQFVVPQGAPTSGAICNLVADQRIDKKILEDIPWMLQYARYSDDIALTNLPQYSLPYPLIKPTMQQLYDNINAGGYRVNYKKTRIYGPGNRKLFLGIVFNKHLNIPRENFDNMRFILHNCRKHGFQSQFSRYGSETAAQMEDQLRGKIAWCKYVNKDKGLKLEGMFHEAKNLRPA